MSFQTSQKTIKFCYTCTSSSSLVRIFCIADTSICDLISKNKSCSHADILFFFFCFLKKMTQLILFEYILWPASLRCKAF